MQLPPRVAKVRRRQACRNNHQETYQSRKALDSIISYITKQWIVFFTHSDLPLNLGTVYAIHLSARESYEQNGFLAS